jgi:sugar phosphate permease
MAGGVAIRGRRHYGWTVAAITFLALLVAAGMRSAPSVLIVPLEEEFGWTRASISVAIALQLLLYGLIGPFAAGVVDRFGARPIMAGGLALMAVSFGATFFVTAAWQLLLVWGVGMGLATGAMALVLGAIIATRWFVARRGLVMGLLTGSAAGGQLVFLPLLANIVVHYSWRLSVMVASIIAVAIIPVVLLLIRDQPADVGLKPYGAPEDAPDEPGRSRANPFGAAFAALGIGLVSRDFWLLSGSFFICGASTLGLIGTHFIPACMDHGIPEATAAGILAAMGVFNFIGTTASGWLSDRFDSRHLLFWYYALRGLSLMFLPYSFDLSFWGLSLFGVFYGLDWVATVPPTVRLTANAFGSQNAGVMFGWVSVVHQIGSAAVAFGAGLMRTQFGNYSSAFVLSGALCLIAAIMVLGIGKKRRDHATPRPALVTAES